MKTCQFANTWWKIASEEKKRCECFSGYWVNWKNWIEKQMWSQINADKMKLVGWLVSDPRPLRTTNASAFTSSFTKNKVLASWFSHCVQWGGKNRQLGKTNKTKKWVCRDIFDETGRYFENLLCKTENGLRNVNWFVGAEEVEAKKTYKAGCRKERWFKTPVLEGEEWWRTGVKRGPEIKAVHWRNYTGQAFPLFPPYIQPRREPKDGELQKIVSRERGYSRHLILSLSAILYSFQMWFISPTGIPYIKRFEKSLRDL